jgi:hypothetical protein
MDSNDADSESGSLEPIKSGFLIRIRNTAGNETKHYGSTNAVERHAKYLTIGTTECKNLP